MQRHPAAKEHQCSYSGNDEEVEILCKVEETEMYT